MKIMLLCGLYLFFLRVLWSVFSELRDPRTVARKRSGESGRRGRRSSPTVAAPPAPALGVPSPAAFASHAGSATPAQGAVAVAAATAAGELVVIEPPEYAGNVFRLAQQTTIGRAATNGIILDDSYVSTVHARIFMRDGYYFAEDLDSRNGIMLNDQPVVAPEALFPGDLLQIGATSMEFS